MAASRRATGPRIFRGVCHARIVRLGVASGTPTSGVNSYVMTSQRLGDKASNHSLAFDVTAVLPFVAEAAKVLRWSRLSRDSRTDPIFGRNVREIHADFENYGTRHGWCLSGQCASLTRTR